MNLNHARRFVLAACCALLPLSLLAADLKSEMEADNARWLAAFNTPDPAAFPAMYAKDAVVLPQGAPAVTGGPEAIGQFWAGLVKRGLKDHTFEVVSAYEDGKYAYQVAKWTVVLVKDTGEQVQLGGNTVRVYERQADGSLLTKVHMYNRP